MNQLEQMMRRSAGIAVVPTLASLILYLSFGDQVMALVFGEQFREGSRLLAILAMGQVVSVLLGSCALALTMTGFQKLVTTVTLATSALTICAELVAAAVFGPRGVAVASALGTIIWNVALAVGVRRVLGIWTVAPFSFDR